MKTTLSQHRYQIVSVFENSAVDLPTVIWIFTIPTFTFSKRNFQHFDAWLSIQPYNDLANSDHWLPSFILCLQPPWRKDLCKHTHFHSVTLSVSFTLPGTVELSGFHLPGQEENKTV
jgi:hypothetical protein